MHHSPLRKNILFYRADLTPFNKCNINDTVILSVLFRYTFWTSNFSKTTRQNFIVNTFSIRVNPVLSEYIFTLKFCRVILEKFDFQKVVEQERHKIERITVRIINKKNFIYFFLFLSLYRLSLNSGPGPLVRVRLESMRR